MESLSNRIKRLRQERNWSREYFGNLIGLAASTVANIENQSIIHGRQCLIKIAHAVTIAKVLGLSFTELTDNCYCLFAEDLGKHKSETVLSREELIKRYPKLFDNIKRKPIQLQRLPVNKFEREVNNLLKKL